MYEDRQLSTEAVNLIREYVDNFPRKGNSNLEPDNAGFSVEAGNRRNSAGCEHKGSRLFKPKNFPCSYELQKKNNKIYSTYDVTCVRG